MATLSSNSLLGEDYPPAFYDASQMPFTDSFPCYFSQGLWDDEVQKALMDNLNAPVDSNIFNYTNGAFQELPSSASTDLSVGSTPPLSLEKPHSTKEETQQQNVSESGLPGDETGQHEVSKPLRRSTRTKTSRQAKAVTPKPLRHTKNSNSDQEHPIADEEPQNDAKTLLRARNRKAAAKFRVRKKCDVEKLRSKEKAASDTNKALNFEACQLRDDILRLKDMLLQHADCGCPRIDDYIQHAAASTWKSSNRASQACVEKT